MNKLFFLSFVLSSFICFSQDAKLGVTIQDVDGNSYKTVVIGTQHWMAENLKTTKFNDGSSIDYVVDNTLWSNSKKGAWCYYEHYTANDQKYGKMYNWYAVSTYTNGNKNVCPKGWHIPTDSEWSVLVEYLGGASIAGGKLKEAGTSNWITPNKDAVNTALFSGIPGGYRGYSGNFFYSNFDGYWWSATEVNSSNAWDRSLNYSTSEVKRGNSSKGKGLSVRCIKD